MSEKSEIARHMLTDLRRNLHDGMMSPGWLARNDSYVVTMLNVVAAHLGSDSELQDRINAAARQVSMNMACHALDEIDCVLGKLETARLVREL